MNRKELPIEHIIPILIGIIVYMSFPTITNATILLIFFLYAICLLIITDKYEKNLQLSKEKIEQEYKLKLKEYRK